MNDGRRHEYPDLRLALFGQETAADRGDDKHRADQCRSTRTEQDVEIVPGMKRLDRRCRHLHSPAER
jgi:hypothetical protein